MVFQLGRVMEFQEGHAMACPYNFFMDNVGSCHGMTLPKNDPAME